MQGECALCLFFSPPLPCLGAVRWQWQRVAACSAARVLVVCCQSRYVHARAPAKDSARIPTGRPSVARVARRGFFCDPPRRLCRGATTVQGGVARRREVRVLCNNVTTNTWPRHAAPARATMTGLTIGAPS